MLLLWFINGLLRGIVIQHNKRVDQFETTGWIVDLYTLPKQTKYRELLLLYLYDAKFIWFSISPHWFMVDSWSQQVILRSKSPDVVFSSILGSNSFFLFYGRLKGSKWTSFTMIFTKLHAWKSLSQARLNPSVFVTNLYKTFCAYTPMFLDCSLWSVSKSQWWTTCHLEKSLVHGWGASRSRCGVYPLLRTYRVFLSITSELLVAIVIYYHWCSSQISLHPVLDKTTYHLINKERLATMKKVTFNECAFVIVKFISGQVQLFLGLMFINPTQYL